MADPFPCPKCRRPAEPAGEVTVYHDDGTEVVLPAYQCEDCVVVAEAGGMMIEAALTFVVENGRAFDPAAPDQPFSSN